MPNDYFVDGLEYPPPGMPALATSEELPSEQWRITPSTTLHPGKLSSTDFLEQLPDPFTKYFYGPAPQTAAVTLPDRYIGASINWVLAQPPRLTPGFLYYQAPPSTALAGSLRYRLTPHYDPASEESPLDAFTQGTDLVVPNTGSLPWSVPVWELARISPLRNLLVSDGWLVPDPDVVGLGSLNERSLALHALGQPFLVEFHMATVRAWILPPWPARPVCARILTNFVDLSSKYPRTPFEGFGLMTIERHPKGFATRLLRVLSRSGAYGRGSTKNKKTLQPIAEMSRPLRVAPIIRRAASSPDHPEYVAAHSAILKAISSLPDYVPLIL